MNNTNVAKNTNTANSNLNNNSTLNSNNTARLITNSTTNTTQNSTINWEQDIADINDRLRDRLILAREHIVSMLETFREGYILRNGVRIAIAGRPNAGKSSLLNLLLKNDRAIVSDVPGTTRDTIEAEADIRGIPVIFIDTAGLRESEDR